MGIVINNPSNATLADNSVTTTKIADGAVTPAKLSTAVQGNNYNYIINSDFKVAQATTSAEIIAGNSVPTASLGYPVFDCWFVYCIGGNITQVAQFPEGSNSAKSLRIMTISSSITSIGIGQRIEAIDAVNLATKTVTLSFECSHTFLTSLTITASRPTTSANTFGTIASPTKTQIATTTISITSTSTRYSWTFTCPQEVERGLEILFTLGATDNAARYFYLANVKLEEGSSTTTFIPTIYAEELNKCQRYFSILPASLYGYPSPSTGGFAFNQLYPLPCVMRIAPVVSRTYSSQANISSTSPQNITPYFFIDRIISTAGTNTTWQLAATCSAYIP